MYNKDAILCHPCQVDQSNALLASLGDEKKRWNKGSNTFKIKMSTICGDLLLMSVFMAYRGILDQNFWYTLFLSWADHMQQAKIKFRYDLAWVEINRY